VKNVTACYRQKLDAILKRRKEYIRASSGSVKLAFRPQLDKSFTRGFTNYFLYERSKDIFSFDTPKSLGEEMGYVKEIRGNFIIVAGVKPFNNGDGICYLDERGKLKGLRINRVENNKLFPAGDMPRIKTRTVLYRNSDQEFEKMMARKSAERKLGVAIALTENNFGFTLTMTDEDDVSVSIAMEREKELARTPQTENIKAQLGKLGNTPFEADRIDVDLKDNWFLPSSVLAEVRREAVEKLLQARRMNYRQEIVSMPKTEHPFPQSELTYLGNVMNEGALSFYRQHGVSKIAPAFEKRPAADAVLMFCKHCLRYSLGWCPVRHKEKSPFREPYYLVSADGKRFRLDFDCKHCQMKVMASGK
jgi:putative protease